MRAIAAAVIACLAALTGASAQTAQRGGAWLVRAQAAGATDPAMLEVPERWKAAYNAKDAAAVAALYAPDAYYVSAHVVARGRTAIRAYFQRGIDAGGHIDEIRILASGQSGDLAYTVGTYEATNAGQKVRGRNVVVLRKIDGAWLMVAHESVVADQP
jgi:uncharacterized protein (TIGR02246 family)